MHIKRRRGNKDQEKVFEEELKKHDRVVAFIKQNIAAQENIIRSVEIRETFITKMFFDISSQGND